MQRPWVSTELEMVVKKLFKKGGDSPVEIPRKRAENIRMAPNGQNFD